MSRTRTSKQKKVEKNFPMNSWNEIEREKKRDSPWLLLLLLLLLLKFHLTLCFWHWKIREDKRTENENEKLILIRIYFVIRKKKSFHSFMCIGVCVCHRFVFILFFPINIKKM